LRADLGWRHGGRAARTDDRGSRANGAATIGLHVFTHNHGARSLYEQLGYVETGRKMAKRL
jgi:ribosomal protein S18 acetylase RimI-like enzyme